MSQRSAGATGCGRVLLALAASALPAHADVIQVASLQGLNGHITTVRHTQTVDLLPSPLVVSTPDNVVTFSLAAGDWRRLDEGVNVLSDFAPGTHLLYTNNNNGFDLNGQGSIGGGGSGPAEIQFAEGVTGFGFRAEAQVLGFETLTFSVYNDIVLLGTFSVSRLNGQHENGSASFLGAQTTGTDLITRIVVSSNVVQLGDHPNDFFFGPVSYVPEPATTALLAVAALAVGRRWRRTGART